MFQIVMTTAAAQYFINDNGAFVFDADMGAKFPTAEAANARLAKLKVNGKKAMFARTKVEAVH